MRFCVTTAHFIGVIVFMIHFSRSWFQLVFTSRAPDFIGRTTRAEATIYQCWFVFLADISTCSQHLAAKIPPQTNGQNGAPDHKVVSNWILVRTSTTCSPGVAHGECVFSIEDSSRFEMGEIVEQISNRIFVGLSRSAVQQSSRK